MRRFVPSMKPEQEPDRDFNEAAWQDAIWQEEQRQAAESAILLRVPVDLKIALTREAGRRTTATGKRVSVNSLIKTILADHFAEIAKANNKAA